MARSPHGPLVAQGDRDGRAGDRGSIPHCWGISLRERLPKMQLKYLCGTGWACRVHFVLICVVFLLLFLLLINFKQYLFFRKAGKQFSFCECQRELY